MTKELSPELHAANLIDVNKQREAKIIEATDKLLNSEYNDEAFAKHIDGFKNAATDINEKRMPITRKLNEIVKQFTSVESNIKKCIDLLQLKRNDYAKKLLDEQNKQKAEAKQAEAKQAEVIEIKATYEVSLRNHIANVIQLMKNAMVKSMKEVNDENYDEKHQRLRDMPVELKDEKLKFDFFFTSRYGNEVESITSIVLSDLKQEMIDHYISEIQEFKLSSLQHIKELKKLPEKEKIEWMGGKQKEIENDTHEMQSINEAKTDLKKDAELTKQALESIQHQVEEVNVKRKIEILVTAHYAYQPLVAFWFSTCFLNCKSEIENKTIKSMIKDLEKHAFDTGEILLDIDGIEYRDVVIAK